VCLAERRYEAVDPANRLIARTLEQRWNDAMRRLLELQTELADFERRTLRAVTAEQKRQIVQLATDFLRLWNASTTAARDRKRMLRLPIKDITIVKAPESKLLQFETLNMSRHRSKQRSLSGSLAAVGEAAVAIECETEMRS
jgi:hypothetical protein